ncbi:hypothetical protein OA92_15725 [Marinomonas sp. SBI22]|uniref:hypothetical protein n=1 Tax=unclassified Marinomonas TaxID=196814 RepID=UPI0005FA7DFD|nr:MULTISPECIES: hypothetical protein [unclassified Marinomonas]KJZ14626.1 hypothetical protein TW85_07760 [Marinomonas sp. S3726]KZM41017.1 hypothetical protein OA92_15725 [Marinomonas sp. SBI22]KZM42857.1 hypothetical protein OA91_13925 [Marinomonas sp. SBI8L]
MQSDPKDLLKKNKELIHSNDLKVTSHVQRPQENWVLHTVMIEGYQVPFRFKRQGKYQSLKGARVNLTYYPTTESVAGIPLEVMKVVRIKRS